MLNEIIKEISNGVDEKTSANQVITCDTHTTHQLLSIDQYISYERWLTYLHMNWFGWVTLCIWIGMFALDQSIPQHIYQEHSIFAHSEVLHYIYIYFKYTFHLYFTISRIK